MNNVNVNTKQIIIGAYEALRCCMKDYLSNATLSQEENESHEETMRNIIQNMRKVKHNPDDVMAYNFLMQLPTSKETTFSPCVLPCKLPKFVRLAQEVWCIETTNKTDEEIASDGIDALSDFITEMGLASSLSDMGIMDG